MNVALVAKDVAPSSAFERLEPELSKQGISSYSYSLSIKRRAERDEAPLHLETWMEHCDVVLLGMSSSEKLAEIEIRAAREAIKRNIPFGFYADTYGCHNRPWFKDFRQSASFLFVINETEAKSAREMYPNAKVVVSGNPMWEDFFTPKLSREEVRQKLEVGDEQKMVLCPGGKNIVDNILHWNMVIEALNGGGISAPWSIFLAMHPKDENNPDVYRDFVDFSIIPVRILKNGDISASEALPGCDIVLGSVSTIGIEAACLRKPVIECFTMIKRARLYRNSGSDRWPLCEMSAAGQIDSYPLGLLFMIRDLLEPESSAKLARRQAELFPAPPEKGASVKMMAETLIELARK